MGSSTLITDYLGSGTHAARQATPPIPAGATALYSETDTGLTFAFVPGTGWAQIGFADAPDDGNLYVRHNNAWEELPAYPAAGVPEAPNDGNPYVRKSEAWEELPAYPAPGVPEAPDDGQLYGRKSEAWAVVTGGGGGGGGLNSDTYWDPSHIGTNGWAVDATGRCCSCFVQTNQWLSLLANKPQTSGKVYFEVVFTTGSSPGPMAGVATAASNRNAYIGSDAYGWSQNVQGTTFNNGSSAQTETAYANGDVIGVAVDFTGGAISFTRNGTANGSFTGLSLTGDTLYPATASPNTGTAMTGHFKAADLQYLPSGFTAWGT